MTDVIPEDLDLSPYGGKWVVISEGKVVAHGDNVMRMAKQIKKAKDPILHLVLDDNAYWCFHACCS